MSSDTHTVDLTDSERLVLIYALTDVMRMGERNSSVQVMRRHEIDMHALADKLLKAPPTGRDR